MADAHALGRSESAMEADAEARNALLERRRYNREYMRRRRADPQFDAHEKMGRERRRLALKLRTARTDASDGLANHDARLCGLCGLLPAKGEIVRLRIVEDSPRGYVEVRMPYCGQC